MKRIFTYLPLLLASLLPSSCTMVDHVIPDNEPTVYVSGFDISNLGYEGKYWKNGASVILPKAASSISIEPLSIAVSGNDVHVVGFEGNAKFQTIGRYWKNGVVTQLDGVPGILNEVVTSGNDVYIAGVGYAPDSSSTSATYWKNGKSVKLDNAVHGGAEAIAMSNNDVYIGGYTFTYLPGARTIATYWKNGIAIPLGDGSKFTSVKSIAVAGNDVHAVGYVVDDSTSNYIGRYWKNGVETPLTGGEKSSNFHVKVSGGDVYITGNDEISPGRYRAKYWKNGIPTTLDDTGASSTDIRGLYIVNNDVYVTGVSLYPVGWVAKYWKNGIPVNLSDGTTSAHPTSIFVVPQ